MHLGNKVALKSGKARRMASAAPILLAREGSNVLIVDVVEEEGGQHRSFVLLCQPTTTDS